MCSLLTYSSARLRRWSLASRTLSSSPVITTMLSSPCLELEFGNRMSTLNSSMMRLMFLPRSPINLRWTRGSMSTSSRNWLSCYSKYIFLLTVFILVTRQIKVCIKILTSWWTIAMMASLACIALSSYPVIVMVSSLASPRLGRFICTPKSVRILVMTEPPFPITRGWYSGSTLNVSSNSLCDDN